MQTNFLDDLNEQQRQAVTHPGGPLLILAGAGSGKTRCLTYRVAWLMSERLVDPDKILLLTFTNKAAGEMKSRVKNLLSSHHPSSINHQPLPFSGTFHSWCAWILRKHAARAGLKPEWLIYDEEDRRQLIKEIISDSKLNSKKFRPNSVSAIISEAKNEMVTPVEYLGLANGEWQETVAKIYGEYQKRLSQSGGLDFDDLLFETVRLFNRDDELLSRYQEQIKYLLIDEYQDTNSVQYKLAKLLSGRQ
ncbi:UvrD-helicase domain-containing protein [Candidatus Collierbacteria bacterium]|nr:UvrD-helicase domain-containing protein [Candidatus Collierbacteria bacterium]